MIEKLRTYFNWDKQEGQPTFYLHEDHRLFDKFEKYYSIINGHLRRRDKSESYNDKMYDRREFQGNEIPYYTLQMILDIYEASDYMIPLQKINNLDTYHMGHIDYIQKLALSLAEEEEHILNKSKDLNE